MRFKIGDIVAWSSQGGGHRKEKVGTVTAIYDVDTGVRYAVTVQSELKRGIPKIYYPWPCGGR